MKTNRLLSVRNNVTGLIAGLFLFVNAASFAQEVFIRLNLPPIDQFTVNDLFNAQVINNSGKDLQVYLKGSVAEATKGMLFDGRSAVFTLPAGFNGLPSFSQLQPVKINYSDKRTEAYVLRTGTVPPGEYTICIKVIDALTQEELGEDCIQTELIAPMPPELIFPENESSVEEIYPLFTWSPPNPVPIKVIIAFVLKVVELLPHQTVAQALASNPAWFRQDNISGTSFQYPVSARPFETGKSYAWQVTAFTQDGEQIAAPSEPYSFTVPEQMTTDWVIRIARPNKGIYIDPSDTKHVICEHYTVQLVNASIAGIRNEMLNNKYPEKMQRANTNKANFWELSPEKINDKYYLEKPDYEADIYTENGQSYFDGSSFLKPDKIYVWTITALDSNNVEHYTDSAAWFTTRKSSTFDNYDFGDAPDVNYKTLFASGGPCHLWSKTTISGVRADSWVMPGGSHPYPGYGAHFYPIPITLSFNEEFVDEHGQCCLGLFPDGYTPENPYLTGECDLSVDWEKKARSSGGVLHDNLDDGVFFHPGIFTPSSTATVDVVVTLGPGYDKSRFLELFGAIDWQNNGDFNDHITPTSTVEDWVTWASAQYVWPGSITSVAVPIATSIHGNYVKIDPRTWGGEENEIMCVIIQLTCLTPGPGVMGSQLNARFRLTPDGGSLGTGFQPKGVTPTDMVISGEVEDYVLVDSTGGNDNNPNLKLVKPYHGQNMGPDPEFQVTLSGMDSETEVIQYFRKKLGMTAIDTSKFTWGVSIYPEGSDQPAYYSETEDIIFLYPEYNPIQSKQSQPNRFPIQGAMFSVKPDINPSLNEGGYTSLVQLFYDGRVVLTSDSGSFHLSGTKRREPVRSCDGLGEWTQTIVSNTEVLVDADGSRTCSRRDFPVVESTRPGCPYTPDGALWIEDPRPESGTTAAPHQFIRCFDLDGCFRNACIEFISSIDYTLYLNDHEIGIHHDPCATSSFSIPESYFIPGGTNVLRFDYSTTTSTIRYHGFAFALHIETEPGHYETDEPVLSLTYPTGTSAYYQCEFTPSGYEPVRHLAPCLPDPSSASTDHILINITDVSGIADLMINATFRATPTATTDCETFSSEYGTMTLTEGGDYTTTPIHGGIQVSIPVSRLYVLFPGIMLPGIIDLDFFVTDGACHPNTLQDDIILNLGCE